MTVESKPTLGVGMVGYAFMGAAHSQAWRNAPSFFDLPLVPDLAVIGGRNRPPRRRWPNGSAGATSRPTGAC